ncbi:MAG: FAD:protein FMN transferase [bacterium]|nr:FAD:protein FMN transferase [bacterium]
MPAFVCIMRSQSHRFSLLLCVSMALVLAGYCDRPVGSGSAGAAADIPEIRLGGAALGTTYNIRIRLDPEGVAARRVAGQDDVAATLEREVQSAIDAMNAAMSNWHPESEISRFNRGGTRAVQISNDFARVVQEAARIHRLSGGAFDPARDTLFALWGFGGGQQAGDSEQARRRLPTPDEIEATLRTSGMQRVQLRGTSLRKTAPELRLNLSAIAKGFAVDIVFRLLERHPLLMADETPPALMVEIGGEVRVGRIIAGRPWRLGVERPRYAADGENDGRRSIFRVAELERTAMATSGDYRNYFVSGEDGVRYSHILDPRSGRPETTGVAQATVIGPDCMTADALATTLLVLGEEAGLKLIASISEYEALLLIATSENEFRTAMSAGMSRWLRPE